ncbi:MAG: flagellar motor protein MotB [Moraxellaceae bacterium]|nr:MAG: flagellar motor protein MotB [Moraxellaceae bacterium]
MKFTKASSILGCAVLAAMTSSVTMADDDSGWYVGANAGQSRARLDEQKIINDVVPNSIPHSFVNDNTIDTGYKLYGGYQLNRYLSIEGGYFDLGEHQFNYAISPAGTVDANMKVRGANLDVVGYLPFTEKFSAFARVGVNYALTQDTFRSSAPNVLGGKVSDRDTFAKGGVGLEYKLSDALAVRVEAERYAISNAFTDHNNIDLYSVGLVYRFGSKPAPQPVVATPPPAPTAAPVVEPPPAPKFEKFTMSATELFTFDSAAVNEAQPKLQQITAAIKGPGAPERVVITGHTDRLGSDAYNQKLSERRAQAVKDYMVANGVAADRLVAEGKGESAPIVQCDDKNKAKLIECLAPNRRVEIDEVKIVREVKTN